MFDDIHIVDPQALADFGAFLLRTSDNYEDAMRGVASQIAAAEAEIAERTRYWERQVAQLEDELSYCLQQEYADCSGIAHALREAEESVELCNRCADDLEAASEDYEVSARKLQNTLNTLVPEGIAYLNSVQSSAEDLLRVAGWAITAWAAGAIHDWKSFESRARQYFRRHALKDEADLVRLTGQGTFPWNDLELPYILRREMPPGIVLHHINSFNRFPELGANPDNGQFVWEPEHIDTHHGSYHRATSGKMFNRRSYIVQWRKKM